MKKTGVSSVPETKRKENIKKEGMASSVQFVPAGVDRPSPPGCFSVTALAVVLPFYFPPGSCCFYELDSQSSP